MNPFTKIAAILFSLLTISGASSAMAEQKYDVTEGDHLLKNFKFHTGETMDVNIHYRTLGPKDGVPVLVLHGTTGSGASMLSDGFAGKLFGPGQPLDASKHYLILPDSIGAGKSSKPSDGKRTAFPKYNYNDMVDAQSRLLKEALGVEHVRLVMGDSMGGMETWTWGVRYPDFADALVPMASLPAPMAGRNWIMRRMLIDSIVTDPEWKDGEYTEQPEKFRIASAWFGLATSGGNQGIQAKAPTNEAAEALIADRLANQKVGDANDLLYVWRASADFDPSADIEKIKAHVLAINSGDDERNPPELGILEKAMPRIKNGSFYIIPAGTNTNGHATTGSQAALYADKLADFLKAVPKK